MCFSAIEAENGKLFSAYCQYCCYRIATGEILGIKTFQVAAGNSSGRKKYRTGLFLYVGFILKVVLYC